MTQEQKIAMLEEAMELSEGSLSPEMDLSDVDAYDSMNKLSIVIMMEDEFGIKLTSDMFKSFVKVEDILNLMQK